MTTVEATAGRAWNLQAAVLADVQSLRARWVSLAGNLHDFHAEKAWQALGIETFNEWVGQPEIGLQRSHAYFLIEAYRELVVERGADIGALMRADISKVGAVLPAIRDGSVDLDDALADVETMSRSDLRDKYADGDDRLDADREPVWRTCPTCSSRVKADRLGDG